MWAWSGSFLVKYNCVLKIRAQIYQYKWKMLNLVMKKLNRKLFYSGIYRVTFQSDLLGSDISQEQQIGDFNPLYKNFSLLSQPQQFQTPGFGNIPNLANLHNSSYSLNDNIRTHLDQDDEFCKDGHYLHQSSQIRSLNPNNLEVCEFNRNLSASTRKQNSERLVETISNVLKENEQRQFVMALRKFISSDKYKKHQRQTPTEEKKFFRKVYGIFLRSLQEIGLAQSLLKLLSESNPKLIKMEDFRNVNDTENWMKQFDQKMTNKLMLTTSLKNKEDIKDEKLINSVKNQQKQKNQTLDFIQKLESSQKQKTKAKTIKLYLKKEPEVQKLRIDKASLEEVQKKLFGNKKIVTEHIILKRTEISKPNEKENNFGQNWVYAYDLPYEFNKQKAIQILNIISQRYGEIVQFRGQSFQNFVQKNYTQTIMHIPQNYRDEDTRNRVKIETEYFIDQELEQQEVKKQKKELAIRMMEKRKSQKDLSLNKSTMVFKFKNKQDKVKFLSHEMRLYGLCFPKLKNVRFEEAQSKSVVALSMIPWACQSAHLLKFINDSLSSLKISVTHPNCIIANGYVFLELANFYEALHSKDLLNNLVFQNQRIKAQLCYGSSYIYEGQYRYNFEQDHYEKLLEKLSESRKNYSSQLK